MTMLIVWVVIPAILLIILMAVAGRKGIGSDAQAGYHAQYDQLTGLINRRLFRDRLVGAIARARREGAFVSVMFLDLDGFKEINDHLGHAAGDEMLRQVASRLIACLRETDTVARLGGDEFTVILEGAKRVEDAGQVATKVLRSIAEPFSIGNKEVSVTASVGIAVYPIDGDTYDVLLECADTAMYEAKQSGKNTFEYFTKSLRDRASERLQLVDDLRDALDTRGQLRVEYQTKVDVVKDSVVGIEAQIRWDHPSYGLLMPDDFLALAAETDLAGPVSAWLLDEACFEMTHWLRDGMRPLRLAVGLSERMIHDAGVVEAVAVSLAAANLDPRHFEVQIPENAVSGKSEQVERSLERLSDMGVRVSLDGFGVGTHSLRWLKRLPIDEIRIDPSVGSSVHSSDESRAIVEAAVAVARSFGLKLTAVGIDSVEALEMVRRLGCTRVQGLAVAPPERPDAVMGVVSRYADRITFS